MPDAIALLGTIPQGIKPAAKVFPVDQLAFKVRYARMVKSAHFADRGRAAIRRVREGRP